MDAREFDNQERPELHRDKEPRRLGVNNTVPKPGPEVFIYRIPADRTLTFTSWGDTIKGLDIHWNGRSSEPHFEPASECECCMKQMPMKWRGYLHCYAVELRQEIFLEFTPKVATSFKSQVANADHLRGCVFQMRRGKSANSRVDCKFLSPVSVNVELPKEKDPIRSVLKLYGYSTNQIEDLLGGADGPPTENDFR